MTERSKRPARLAPSPERFQLSWLQPATPLAGLYLTGSDIVSNGFAGALVGGALTAFAVDLRTVWHNLRAVVRL